MFFLLANFKLSFHKNDKPCWSLMYCMWFCFEQKSQLHFKANEQKTAEQTRVIFSFTAVGFKLPWLRLKHPNESLSTGNPFHLYLNCYAMAAIQRQSFDRDAKIRISVVLQMLVAVT